MGHDLGIVGATSRSLEYGSPCGSFEFAERTSDGSMHSVGADYFLADEAKLGSEASKLDVCGYDMSKAELYDERGHDLFDMSSFFREPGALRTDSDEMQALDTDFTEGLISPAIISPDKHDLMEEDQQNDSSDTIAEPLLDVSDSSADSVVMGIPYYVACQWQQMQQQQQQQQQAMMMLWWQAYLSGAYNMLGPKSASQSSPMGWSLPTASLAAFNGAYANLGDDGFYKHMLMMDDKSNATNIGSKRRRKTDASYPADVTQQNTKKGRRPRHDERVCKNCGTNETPFWRKDKQDGLPLCNACGLYLSKNDAPRPKVLWKTSDRSLSIPATSSGTTPVAVQNAATLIV